MKHSSQEVVQYMPDEGQGQIVSMDSRVTVMDDDGQNRASQLATIDFSNEAIRSHIGHRVKDENVLRAISAKMQRVARAEYQALISQHGPAVMQTMADTVRAHVQRTAVLKAEEMMREHEHRLAMEEHKIRAKMEAREQQRQSELEQQRQQHAAMNGSNTMTVYQPSGFDNGPCAMDMDDDSYSGHLMLECGTEQLQWQQQTAVQGEQFVETHHHHFRRHTVERYTERQTTYQGSAQQRPAQNGLCRAFLNNGTKQCGNERISNSPYCKQHDYNAAKGVMSAQEWLQTIVHLETLRPKGFCLAWYKNGNILCKEQQVPGSPYCAKHDCSSQKGAPLNWLSN